MKNYEDYDVIVIGSGAGGMLTAARCHDLGFKVVVFEKSQVYGGTSALSGGQFWVPGNHLKTEPDDVKSVGDYLRAVTNGQVNEKKMHSYLSNAPAMAKYLEDIGVKLEYVEGLSDYYSEVAGSSALGRAIAPAAFDAAALGDEFQRLREAPSLWKIGGRYSIDTRELGLYAARSKGWRRTFVRTFLRYWSDLPWRLKTQRDRRLTMGNALVARLRKAMAERSIPLILNTEMVRLVEAHGRVIGVVLSQSGQEIVANARRAVVLAAGGFEHNQEMRERYLRASTDSRFSLGADTNTGDALRSGLAIGADTEFLSHAWWTPAMTLPTENATNTVSHAVFRMPGCILLNRRTERFVNESASYDRVGQAMIVDNEATGANLPCWLIFDATYRARYGAGGILPSILMPDVRIPKVWWDNILFRSKSLIELAGKIGLDSTKLERIVEATNGYAKIGADPQFRRGDYPFDRATGGDPRVSPNPCLAPIDKPPFYAIRVFLGDIGTKGGLKVDENSQVVDTSERCIPGLYATGNTSGALFAGAYPGPGATLGPALTFGYIAAGHIGGQENSRQNSTAQIYSPTLPFDQA